MRIFRKFLIYFMLYLKKLFPHSVRCNLNNNMKNMKGCSPCITLDSNASSIIIGLSLLFCLSLSLFRSSDSSRQHPTDYRAVFHETRRSFSSTATSSIADSLKSAKQCAEIVAFISRVFRERAKYLGQRDLEVRRRCAHRDGGI